MAATSFSSIKTTVADWLDRDDMSATAGPLDFMIGFAEDKIYREMRLRFMETSTSPVIASGVVAIPSLHLETKQINVENGGLSHRLDPRASDWIYAAYPTRSASGLPQFFAQEGDNYIFGPYPDSTYTVNIQYYAKPDRLSTSNETNWLTTNAADLLMFETLLQSIGYLGADERVPYWQAERDRAFRQVMEQNRDERYPKEIAMRTHPA